MNDELDLTPVVKPTTMLVGMTFGLPRQTRGLKKEAAQIEQNAHAAPGTVMGSMFYFREGKKDGMHTLKKFQAAWKTSLKYYARYPFSTMSLLPAALAKQACDVNIKYKEQEQAVIDAWIKDEYPEWADPVKAQTRMGSMYDVSDFPSSDECRKSFSCDVTIVPLAAADQWQRIALLAPDLAAVMEKESSEKAKAMMDAALAKTWQDMMDEVQHVVDVLSKDKGKIYETLIESVIKFADIVPAFNQGGDEKLNALAATVKAELGTLTADDIRQSDDIRKATLVKATTIINQFKPFQRKLEM